MRKIFIATHADLSKGLKSAAQLIVGDLASEITTFSLQAGGDADDFRAEVVEFKESHPDTEIVILTDLYGASLFNSMSVLAEEENVYVFTGTNLAMVLDLLLEPNALNEEIINQKIALYREGVMWLDKLPEVEEDDF